MINCLIVDDAPVARDILVEYCQLLPVLKVVGICEDAFDARDKIQQLHIDILFVDINMPLLSGIDLVRTLKHPPQVIFTTAYKEYATDAFDLSACDYLVKPFSIERFIIAIDKAVEKINSRSILPKTNINEEKKDHLFVRTEGSVYKVNFESILVLEASRNNTKVFTKEKTLLSTMALSSTEKLLPANQFLRVHRSFIINRSKITSLHGNIVYIDSSKIPIGTSYKTEFLRNLGFPC